MIYVLIFNRMENFAPPCSSDATLKGKFDNIGWEYGDLVDPGKSQRVKCKSCKRVLSGVVFRLKQHIARIKGNVISCDRSTPINQVKCKRALEEVRNMKENKRKTLEESWE
ncbi:hypothetical protein DCAR_0831193 [Daucus carota subsp. sativus]|uniref:BED-type domain-containing protein n=1 Tax=Daucus carota subsp. sativus TaxID=79200 RepID=A0AAF0XR16_DAUCS|nr:hypothetical protein DCAR_0831193 [Daucus carota subsp. sativus]